MLERFEKWVLSIKKKIDPRYFGVFMFVVFGAMVMLAMNYINVYGREKGISTDTNNRAMYEIITNVNNIDTLVAKIRITKSNEYNISTLAGVLAEANSAKDNLSILPVSQDTSKNASLFLSQVIGYFESLIKKLSSGENLSNEDYTNLEKINNVANNLNNTLSKIYEKLSKGRINWDEVEKLATNELNDSKNSLKLTGLSEVKKSLEDYEGLIYDGAFSSHIESLKPKMLNGENISKDEAEKIAKEYVEKIYHNLDNKKEIEEVIYNGEYDGKLDIYSFEIKLKDTDYTISVDISKNRGLLVLLLTNREVLEKNIDIKEAKKIGEDYLKEIGFSNLEATYYLEQNNMVTINYAAKEKDVIIYPDLVKVKVAMDTKEILSVETTGYLFNHYERSNLNPVITETKARENINKNVKIDSVRLAVIPLESKKEVLTYEFKGSINENVFLIYVNALTGVEENILLLLKTKGGYLTI